MQTVIIAAVVAGYIVQFAAALVVVLQHAREKMKASPQRLMR